MKALYWRLLIVALSFGFIFESFAQGINIINPLPTNVNSKLQLGLEEVVNLVERNQSLNELTLSGFSSYDLKANNTKIKVDIITAGDPNVLYKELVALELEIVARHKNIITCWVDIAKVKSLLGKTENIQWIQSSLKPIHNAGVVQSQGDAAQRSDIVRSTYGLNGSGVKVGVLSDSYNNLNGAAAGVTAGELPGTTNPSGFTTPVVVLSDLSSGGSDEGRAMCEIVHDVAPGAQLYFYSAFNGQPDFANGIRALADAGCKVINDDITYFSEPIFQDGIIAQAIDYAVNVKGAVYFSSAGNSNDKSYEAPYQASTYQPFNDGQTAHNFGTAAAPIYLLPVGGTIRLGFQWDEPYLSAGNGSPGSASDMNIYVLTTTDNMNFTVVSQGVVNNIGSDPNELINQVGGANTKYILVTKKSGPNPTRIKITDFSRQLSWTPTPSTIVGIKAGTVTGHHNATGDITCGAASYDKTPAFGVTPPEIESYSSRGGTPIMFSVSGVRLATPDDRLKPVITAPDNANTSFFIAGYDPENDGKPNFPGTSAAAPHAAGVAALMLQGNPGLSFAAIKTALINSCVDMDDDQTPSFDVGFDYRTGNGLIKADAAVAATINPNCPPSVVTITRPTTFCEGDSVIFNANTGSGYTYQWKKNSVNITGATNATLIVKESGAYNVDITNVDCTASSESTQVIKNPGVPPPTTVNRTITFGTPITVGNGLQASTICYDNPQTGSYTGPTVGYDGGNSSGANPTINFSGLTGNIVKTRVSITWRKRAGGGGINDCGTTGSNGIPYNNEISFNIKSPNNTEISLLGYGTYAQGTSPAGVVTTVFEDGGAAVGTTPASGTFAPAQSLTKLSEQVANGTWTLIPYDDIGGEPLCVQSFSVTVYVSGNSSPSSITWWTAATGGTQVGTGTEYIPADVNVGTYTYYAQGGCSNGFACNTSIRKPAILKINDPDLPPTPVATGTTICKGSSATLTATGCTGTSLTLLWYQNVDNVEVTMPVSPTATTQYYARCRQETIETGGTPYVISEKSNVVSVTVLDPAAPVATGASINLGSSVTLTATGCTGAGFALKWYQTADNVEVTMPVSPITDTQYYAKCQQTVGSTVCLSAKSNDVTVTVVILSVTVVYVNIANAAAPVQNGSSWATAYGNLQTALAAAPANAEVWVAAGTYKPTTTANRNISFNIPSGIMLYGGFAGTELSQNQRNFNTNKTILSGEIGSSSVNDNSYHVVLFNGANNATLLDGFVVRSGNANLSDAQSNSPSLSGLPISVNDGGGIGLDNGSSPMIINCTITNNYAVSGGGLFAANGSNPTVKNCMFTSNKATFGGGAYHIASSPTYNNVLFSGNNATGGAIYNNSANPTITNTTIAGNGGYNGAIFNASSSPVVKNSILWGNIAPFNDTQSITTYSIVEGGYNGVGNLNINPQFINLVHFGLSPTPSGNYQLTNTSPAIDAGDNGSITITDKDLIDNLRRYNAGIVDMGAYEFQGSRVGTTIKSVTSGNWENNSTWNIGRIPLAGDNVIIDNNHNVTIMNSGTAKNVEVRSNAKIIYNQSLSKLQTGI
jgi:hypothetical protein